MSMTREEAMRARLDGAKITHPNWEKGFYTYVDFSKSYPYRNSHEQRFDYLYFKDGYEIYKEKVKRKIVRWVNVYKEHEKVFSSELRAREYAYDDALAVAVKMEVEIEVEV